MSDTGTGMTPEILAHVFEPFFTTKAMGKGTGLGLAVVIGIVKQSKGHIEIYSEVEVGTTFRIFFPAVQDQPNPGKDPDQDKQPQGTETVLFVEDEDSIRAFALGGLAVPRLPGPEKPATAGSTRSGWPASGSDRLAGHRPGDAEPERPRPGGNLAATLPPFEGVVHERLYLMMRWSDTAWRKRR